MHRIAISIAVVASVLFAGASAALADPPSTETVITRNNVVSGPVTNPCSGQTGTLTLTYTDVFHITDFGTGVLHLVDVQTGDLTFTPDGSTTPTGSGHLGTTFNWQSTPSGLAFTITNPTLYVAHFPDGSNVLVHSVYHITRTPAGDVTTEFSDATLECAP